MKIVIPILFFFTGLTSYGQELTDKEAFFNILRTYRPEDPIRLESTNKALQHFIITKPASDCKIMSLFYLAEIAKLLDKTDSASLLYSQVLSMTVPDSIDWMNCRNNSTKRLAEICINRKDYCSALNYLDLAGTTFPPRFSCGTAHMEDNLKITILYSRCYSGQGYYQQAIARLAPYMFANGFARNDKLVTELYNTWLKVYTREEIKNEFAGLQEKVFIYKEVIREYVFLRPKIKIFDQEVEIPVYDYNLERITEQQQIQTSIKKIESSEIYKLATTH